jgi:hypothetical protein
MENNKHIQKFNEHQENLNISDVSSFKKLLSDNDRKIILDMFEKVQTKYSRKAGQAETNGKEDKIIFYNYGVVDGINHCIKMIMGIEDDYLDGV